MCVFDCSTCASVSISLLIGYVELTLFGTYISYILYSIILYFNHTIIVLFDKLVQQTQVDYFPAYLDL